jgi:hypothetical protein
MVLRMAIYIGRNILQGLRMMTVPMATAALLVGTSEKAFKEKVLPLVKTHQAYPGGRISVDVESLQEYRGDAFSPDELEMAENRRKGRREYQTGRYYRLKGVVTGDSGQGLGAAY